MNSLRDLPKAAKWRKLESLLDRMENRRTQTMIPAEQDEFVRLYRSTCLDLAKVKSKNPGYSVERYLNSLVARGHALFRSPVNQGLSVLWRFFSIVFPGEVRRMKGYVLAAVLLFVLPLFVSAALVYFHPATAYALASPDMLEAMTNAYAEGHAEGRAESADSLMTGFYINNNVGVAFQCFASGIFFGIGAMVALVFNGVAIGAVGGYICSAGYGDNFLSFVSGHGAFELTAIVLAGAMGLRIGMLLVNPGIFTRSAALKKHGPAILKIVMGAAAMLVIAAFIEGFWSPSSAPSIVKFIVAAVLWALVLLYFALAGRRVLVRRDSVSRDW